MELEAIFRAKEDFDRAIMPKTQQAIREFITETDRGFQDRARFVYLKDRITGRIVRAWELMACIESYFERDRVIERHLSWEDLEETLKELIKLWAEATSVRRALEGKPSNRVTQEDIDRAREDYPITNLIEIRNKLARCPFHEDKTASMYQYGNRVYCFSCHKGWDTIGLLMERDGLLFPEAVRRLAS